MNESKWFEEIMLQKFSSYSQKDITKLLFVYFISENKKIELCWNIKDLYNYIYDFYIDNNCYAKINPSSIIRNINKYGVDDIVGVVSSNLIEWKDDSKNSILQFDNCNNWLSLDSVSDNFYTMSKQVADMVTRNSVV